MDLGRPWADLPSFFVPAPALIRLKVYLEVPQFTRDLLLLLFLAGIDAQTSNLRVGSSNLSERARSRFLEAALLPTQNRSIRFEIFRLLCEAFHKILSPMNVIRSPGASSAGSRGWNAVVSARGFRRMDDKESR
jgi:hypothetical protein